MGVAALSMPDFLSTFSKGGLEKCDIAGSSFGVIAG
jgi:hypothetical protein